MMPLTGLWILASMLFKHLNAPGSTSYEIYKADGTEVVVVSEATKIVAGAAAGAVDNIDLSTVDVGTNPTFDFGAGDLIGVSCDPTNVPTNTWWRLTFRKTSAP